MSIIQSVITDKYCIISGDSRMTYLKDNSVVSGINKIIKLNSLIMFGITGNPYDSFKLFDGFCYYHTSKGFENVDTAINITYSEFMKIITERYKIMEQEHKLGIKKYDLGDIVCGVNKNDFEITSFNLGSKEHLDGVYTARKSLNFPYKAAIVGSKGSDDILSELAQSLYFKYKEQLSVLQWKNIMREVVDITSKYDNTIDTNIKFEVIRKIENNGNIFYK